MRMFSPRSLFLSICTVVGALPAFGACTGSSPNWTTTPDRASVADCASRARNGDTIRISAGTASWGDYVTLRGFSSLTVVGAGVGATRVNDGGFNFDSSKVDLSGIEFTASKINAYGPSQGFRIHHIKMSNTSAENCMLFYGDAQPTWGVIDHSDFVYCQMQVLGTEFGRKQNANVRWREPNNVGTQNAIYFEDSTFTNPDGSSGSYFNCFDANLAGSYVVRFSVLDGCRFEVHGLQAENNRGTKTWEMYHNTLKNTGVPSYRPWFLRAGTGMVFNNTSTGFVRNSIYIDNNRSYQTSIGAALGTFGFCDGTKWLDGNTSGGTGWPCRDQIGRSQDVALWDFGPNAPAQSSAPAYFWKNTDLSSELAVIVQCPEGTQTQCENHTLRHVLENRDFFVFKANFNGTSGIGVGPLSARPSSCTAGVGYWATDQGEWNSRQSGPDGLLYRCSATNTWTAHYTPLAYPHPLVQGAGGGASLLPPSGLAGTPVRQ